MVVIRCISVLPHFLGKIVLLSKYTRTPHGVRSLFVFEKWICWVFDKAGLGLSKHMVDMEELLPACTAHVLWPSL